MKPWLLILVASLALADEPVQRYRVGKGRGRVTRCDLHPALCSSGLAFQVFPSGGAGVAGVCSTTPPTTAAGVAGTIVRATSATCQSTAAGGMVSTGIANGELSTLGAGVARLEYDRQGVLGARVEGTRVNPALRSQELENAYWVVGGVGAAAPTVTANFATAPNGTVTADRVQISACPAVGNYSLVYKTAIDVAAVHTGSVLCRGTSASQTISVCGYGGASTNTLCQQFTCPSTSWSRLSVVTPTANGTGLLMGCEHENTYTGSNVDTGAADVLLWVTGLEPGTFATSPILTTTASVTRNADVISFPVTLSGTTFSAAASYDAPSVLATGATAFQVYVDANNSVTASVSAAGKLTCTFRIGGVDSTVDSAAALTASTVNRVACQYDGTSRKACLGGTCASTAGALTVPTGAATFYVGTRAATGNECNGIISRGCYDPSGCI